MANQSKRIIKERLPNPSLFSLSVEASEARCVEHGSGREGTAARRGEEGQLPGQELGGGGDGPRRGSWPSPWITPSAAARASAAASAAPSPLFLSSSFWRLIGNDETRRGATRCHGVDGGGEAGSPCKRQGTQQHRLTEMARLTQMDVTPSCLRCPRPPPPLRVASHVPACRRCPRLLLFCLRPASVVPARRHPLHRHPQIPLHQLLG